MLVSNFYTAQADGDPIMAMGMSFDTRPSQTVIGRQIKKKYGLAKKKPAAILPRSAAGFLLLKKGLYSNK